MAPNLVVSVAVAGPWVAARVVSFSAGVAAAQSSARASSLPSSQSLEAGEAVSWERQLLARPVGVAIKSATGGTSVPVAMSGAVDVFDRLVPGCRSFSSLNLARCAILAREALTPVRTPASAPSPLTLGPAHWRFCPLTLLFAQLYRYLVDPDGSLRCGEMPSSDGGLKASDSVSHPLGLAVSRSVMVLSGPMPAAERGAI